MKKRKNIPAFSSEADEQVFWETHDSSEYLDWSKDEKMQFSKLKPSTQSISIRLPLTLLDRIKLEENKRDVPYQSLIKICLAEDVARQRQA
ncbi:MAG: BrnA antitoxin family protein [Leptospirillum sp.]|jgi:predicted DNA binding CopG/RHH family protein